MKRTDRGYQLSSGREIPAPAGVIGLQPRVSISGTTTLTVGFEHAFSEDGVPLTDAERIELAEHAAAHWLMWARPATEETANDGAACESIDSWGEYDGRPRRACPNDPRLQPVAAPESCPRCAMKVAPGAAHPHPADDYELMRGHDWPPGYVSVRLLKWGKVPKAKNVQGAQLSPGTMAFVERTPDQMYGLVIDCRMKFRSDAGARAYAEIFAGALDELTELLRFRTT